MPSKTTPDGEAARPTGPHTPVSNESEQKTETEAAGKPVSQPPSEGKNPRTNKVTDGTEEVPGHSRTEMASLGSDEAPPTLFLAPRTTQLRDIAEASFGPPPPSAETVHGPDDRV